MTVGHLANVILLFFKAEKNPEIVSLSLSLASQSHNTEILSARGHISRAPFKKRFLFSDQICCSIASNIFLDWCSWSGQSLSSKSVNYLNSRTKRHIWLTLDILQLFLRIFLVLSGEQVPFSKQDYLIFWKISFFSESPCWKSLSCPGVSSSPSQFDSSPGSKKKTATLSTEVHPHLPL